MGTATSTQNESVEIKEVTSTKEDESRDTKLPSEEATENNGGNQDDKEPVVEEEIVPEVSRQVRSIITAPKVNCIK